MKIFIITMLLSMNSYAESTESVVKDLFKTLNIKEEFDAEITKGIDYLIETNIALSPLETELKRYTKKNLNWSHMEPEMTKKYMSLFSKKELKGLVEFFTTPEGKKYARVGPALTMEIAHMTQKKAKVALENFFKDLDRRKPAQEEKELTVLEKLERDEKNNK